MKIGSGVTLRKHNYRNLNQSITLRLEEEGCLEGSIDTLWHIALVAFFHTKYT